MTYNGPAIQPQNMTHMFGLLDVPPCFDPKNKIDENSIYGYLMKNPRFSKMLALVNKANLQNLLNSKQANFTLFATPDEFLKQVDVNVLDVGLARQTILMSLLDNKITFKWLAGCPIKYYVTKNQEQKMYITALYNRVKLNEMSYIVGFDIECDNGIIHLTDNLLRPTNNPYLN